MPKYLDKFLTFIGNASPREHPYMQHLRLAAEAKKKEQVEAPLIDGELKENGDVHHDEDGKIGKVLPVPGGYVGKLDDGFKTKPLGSKKEAARAILKHQVDVLLVSGASEQLLDQLRRLKRDVPG